jgi:hypothetical protein
VTNAFGPSRHLISCSSSNNLSVITTDIFDANYRFNRYDSVFCNGGLICDNKSVVEILTFHCTLFYVTESKNFSLRTNLMLLSSNSPIKGMKLVRTGCRVALRNEFMNLLSISTDSGDSSVETSLQAVNKVDN